MAAGGKSKILIIGGTGYIGKFIVEASANAGHPTFALVRESCPKRELIEGFRSAGVTLLRGDIHDHATLLDAVRRVDVVVSAVGHAQLADQTKIIAAIKEAGNVTRFLPSEFGNDVDRTHAVEPARSAFRQKAQIRRAVEREGIPFTVVSSNFFAGYFLPNLAQFGLTAPPRDRVTVVGDGNVKAVFNREEDIAAYTVRAADDPRTLNKIVYVRPPKNTLSFNELVALWERKIGKAVERVHLDEQRVLKNIEESPAPLNVVWAINHAVFVKGDQTNFDIDASSGLEASQLYPDVNFTTVDEYLDRFV